MMPMLRRLRLLALALVGSAAVAWAHTGGSTGYASITASGSTIRYTVILPAATLPSDRVEDRRRAREGSQRGRETLLDVLRTRIGFVADGIRCEPGPGQVVASAVDAPTFTMLLDFACATVTRELIVHDDIFDLLGPDHHTLAKVEGPTGIQQFAFAPDSAISSGHSSRRERDLPEPSANAHASRESSLRTRRPSDGPPEGQWRRSPAPG